MKSNWKSRKLWITIAAMLLPALLLAGSTYVLVTAPEKAGALAALAGAVSAVRTTAAGATYVVTEGKIDLRALPQLIDPILQGILELAGKNADLYEEIVKVADRHLPADAPELPETAGDTQDTE